MAVYTYETSKIHDFILAIIMLEPVMCKIINTRVIITKIFAIQDPTRWTNECLASDCAGRMTVS